MSVLPPRPRSDLAPSGDLAHQSRVALEPLPSQGLHGRQVARILGDGLKSLGLRTGDCVVLAARERAEHGDLVALVLPGDPVGGLTLWKVHGADAGFRLWTQSAQHQIAYDTAIHGVVLAVLRRFR